MTIDDKDYIYRHKIHLINITNSDAKSLSIASTNIFTTLTVDAYDGRARVYFQDCVKFKDNIILKSVEVEGNYTPQNEYFYLGEKQILDGNPSLNFVFETIVLNESLCPQSFVPKRG